MSKKYSVLTKEASRSLKKVIDLDTPLCDIFLQYNTDRFKYFRQSVTSSSKNPLVVENSPHVNFLNIYNSVGDDIYDIIKSTNYFRMHKLYGRNKKWIIKKAKSFVDLYEEIKKNGFDKSKSIILLSSPLVRSKFNKSGYEVYEGHHRVACCFFLKMETVPSIIMKIGN